MCYVFLLHTNIQKMYNLFVTTVITLYICITITNKNTHIMKPQFEIEVEYESLERIELMVIQDLDQDIYWRINWDRISDKLVLDHQFSCDKPLPKGVMDEAFIILNERLDLLQEEYNQDIQEREEQRDMYVYNGVRRSDFF